MKLKIKIVLLFALVFAGACMPAFAKKGDSCSDPIRLDPEYYEEVAGPVSKWYEAHTFDLPMAISFYPNDPNADAPKLELDFGCDPGHYDDPIICSLFCIGSAYVALPYTQIPSKSYDDNGDLRYHLAFGEMFRDMLLSHGISYDVPVYIRATFYCGGRLIMERDAFNNCMDGHKFMQYGDTVNVQPEDKESHVIVPYIQWKDDSIRYIWQGAEKCILAVGNNCDFDPLSMDPVIIDNVTIEPGGMAKVSSALLKKYVTDQKNYPNEGGMYFAKCYSESPGVLKVEKIPAPAPSGGATMLRCGFRADVNRNDTNTLYAIPSSWTDDIQFFTPTDHVFRMYIGKTADFTTADAIATYQFDRTDDGHVLNLFSAEMDALWKKKAASQNYLYIRFECTEDTYILPDYWSPSDCVQKIERIEKGVAFEVVANSRNIYGLYYADWKGGAMTFAWSSTQSACKAFFADTCDIPTREEAPVYYMLNVPKKGTTAVCDQATVDSWANKVDPDGYIYVRFNSSGKAKMTITSEAPEETDPLCSTVNEVENVTAWDEYTWRGETYTQSGTIQKDGTVDPETLCMDSTFTLNLTIHTTSYDSHTETGCDSIAFNEKVYRENFEGLDTIYDAQGNRTIMDLQLTVNASSESTIDTIVWDEPFISASGKVINQSEDFLDTVPNTAGCDSVITYHVTIHTTTHDSYEASGCDSVEYKGEFYKESTAFDDVDEDTEGNKTIIAVTLQVFHSSSEEQTIRQEEPFETVSGKWIEISGEYMDTIPNTAGCDSVITYHVTIFRTEYDTVPYKGCDSIVIDGTPYKQSCAFNDTITDTDENVFITTHILTVGHTSYIELTEKDCEAHTLPSGRIVTASGDYVDTIPNASGCDSIITLHLTMRASCTTVYDTVYICAGTPMGDEEIADGYVRRYIPYAYRSPATWDYMEGVMESEEADGAMMNLARAERNLREHYNNTGEMPVESIVWTYCPTGGVAYTLLDVEAQQPQWVAAGVVVIQVQFLCGEIFYSSITTDNEQVPMAEKPVKTIEDGQVIILRGGHRYNVQGQRLK